MVTYTTTDKVGNLLGFPTGYFTTSTTPTPTVIENLIERAEDQIEFATGHAWKEVTVTDEYIEPSSDYEYGTGIPFKLLNRSIRSITKLEVWTGSEWEDFVITKTEGRDKDYWVDFKNGFIFITCRSQIYPRGVRTTYKFGETTVNKYVEEAATKIAAIEILNNPEFSVVVFTDAGQSYSKQDSRIKIWQDKVDKILLDLSEFKIV